MRHAPSDAKQADDHGGKSRGHRQGPESSSAPQVSLVSHIPRSISFGSHLYRLAGSVSSVEGCRHAPPSRDSDDETDGSPTKKLAIIVKDSSSDSEASSTEVDLVSKKRTANFQLSRQVSDSDLGDDSARNAKKTRLVSPPQQVVEYISTTRLLFLPQDSTVLNPVHVFCRQQLEVFTATAADLAQPAPGRKNPIRLHQVGLRCLHCKNLPTKRVKRAVCYPSSVGRVYHSVSDMKFDHFTNCTGLPDDLRAQFEELKASATSKKIGDRKSGSSASTAQYYHDSALRMGMEDKYGGIFMAGQVVDTIPTDFATFKSKTPMYKPRASPAPKKVVKPASPKKVVKPTAVPVPPPLTVPSHHSATNSLPFSSLAAYRQLVAAYQLQAAALRQQQAEHASVVTCALLPPVARVQTAPPHPMSPRDYIKSNSMPLATALDSKYLNPLHCFVRKHTEIFVATEEDASAPAPGRKIKVLVGQVGIRCISCTKLSKKDRVKRAACYPPSVAGVYHSMSNMKFDHFGSCKGLSPKAREEFSMLRKSHHRGMSNSTAQYYHDSAIRLGLVDTPAGIRLKSIPPQATDGISALMHAAAANSNPMDVMKHKGKL